METAAPAEPGGRGKMNRRRRQEEEEEKERKVMGTKVKSKDP